MTPEMLKDAETTQAKETKQVYEEDEEVMRKKKKKRE